MVLYGGRIFTPAYNVLRGLAGCLRTGSAPLQWTDFVTGLAAGAGAGAPASIGPSIGLAAAFLGTYHTAGGSEGVTRAALCN